MQFGHVMGNRFENQVLIIKTAWGGKDLCKDFRPLSSGGAVGPFYLEMIGTVKKMLGDLKYSSPAMRAAATKSRALCGGMGGMTFGVRRARPTTSLRTARLTSSSAMHSAKECSSCFRSEVGLLPES